MRPLWINSEALVLAYLTFVVFVYDGVINFELVLGFYVIIVAVCLHFLCNLHFLRSSFTFLDLSWPILTYRDLSRPVLTYPDLS